MHVFKKTRMALLLAILLSVLLSACSGGNGDGNANANEPSGNEGSLNGEALPAKFDPLVTITQMGCLNDTVRFREGESLSDNVHTRWVKENLGIELKFTWETNMEQCSTKLRLALASGEKLPDIMKVTDETLASDLMESGRLMDITEAFNQYASEQVKAIYNQDLSYWYKVSKDDKRYGIPILARALQNDPVMWIREDWLKQLNLKAPATLDEMEVVMDAFIKANPGSKPKPVGLAISLKENYATWMADASVLFGAYGVIPGYWNKWDGGELTYGSVQPQAKEALARMQDWYKKGYISPDAALSDEIKASELFTSEQTGIIFGPNWMAGWPLQVVLQANNPDAEFKAYPVPAGPSGKSGPHFSNIPEGRLLVSKEFKHIDAFMLYLNELYKMGDPDEGSEFQYGYAEGYDHIVVDGKPVWKSDQIPGGALEVFKYFPLHAMPTDPYQEFNSYKKIINNEELIRPSEKNLKLNLDSTVEGPLKLEAMKVLDSQMENTIANLFIGSPTETMKDQGEAMKKLETEMFTKIIYGDAPIDDFDKFVEKWKNLGGEKVTKEVNEWYQSVGGK